MKNLLTTTALATLVCLGANAQRFTDKLDRGLVAVKVAGGVYCSWRVQADEYYDVKYNLYRDGTKVNSEPLDVSNFTDSSGSINSTYTVKAVVAGVEQTASKAASVFAQNYKEIIIQYPSELKSKYEPNDACCADVDGDGELEILLKFTNINEHDQLFPINGPTVDGVETKEYSMLACLKQDGSILWWVNCGPNMGDFQNNEQNIVGYDWDMDGKAEVVMRLEEGSTVHMADGTTYTIGADGQNGSKWTNYRSPKSAGSTEWFTHYGNEFLFYCEGATGKPYQCVEFPLKRLEDGETDLEKAWGDGYGHRSSKFFFGAPYLDGKKPSIFLGRGIYTRHKFVALDVDPATHALTERWRWTNNQKGSPWYGQGYHNYTIADVDWDGRDEIVWGSMVIDDNGKGLSTTGLGHGDAHHVGDLNPYIHGQEVFACNEDRPANNYRDATTSEIYYRLQGGTDAGRAVAGNFFNDFPGSIGYGAHDTPISTVTNDHVGVSTTGIGQNFRIYWDGDLLEEGFNDVSVSKPGKGVLETFSGVYSNNSTKATPCYQGDVFGDWREEVIERTASNNIRIFTTTIPTEWRNYSLWYDHQYRNAMVWQPCGYNQPPHASYFLGELENITVAPPPLTTTGRTEVGTTIGTDLNGKHAMLSTTGDATVAVASGAAPSIFTDNAPSWVQGTAASECTVQKTPINYAYYTHTLTGAGFTGSMRLVKQGDGTLVLPNVDQTYTGKTDVWAGTLQFDGTMESSPVWLNRFAELNSNGGNFKGGIKADYGSIIRPGGKDAVGTMTVSTLELGFGSRVVFDVNGTNTDKIVANTIKVEKKDWKNGPKYTTPVFEFTSHLEPGSYEIAEAATIEGSVSDIVVEGLDGKKYDLEHKDGKLILTIYDMRAAEDVTWTGANGSAWDLQNTENFKSTDNKFVSEDNVTFDDTAETTDVVIGSDLTVGSVVFKNNAKAYTIFGAGAILGDKSLTVEGTGNVAINNTNKYTGGTVVDGGNLTAATFANSTITAYGSLGNGSITLKNKGTLNVPAATSTQPITIGENGGTLNVTSGTFKTDAAIKKASGVTARNLYKSGAGTLALNQTADYDTLYVNAGTVYDSGDTHFVGKTIVLNGSNVTLQANNSTGSYSSDSPNIIVPKGKSAIWYPDGRCEYTGKLSGEGTIDIYGTWIRCYHKGDWSEFAGKINAKRLTYQVSGYDVVFDYCSSKGMPNATLNLDASLTTSLPFYTNGYSFSIGELTGTGCIKNGGNASNGTSKLTIGTKNTNFQFDGTIVGCNVEKAGTGRWTIKNSTALENALGLVVADGTVKMDNSTATTSLTGPTTVVRDSGELYGVGYVNNLTVGNGGKVCPGANGTAKPTQNSSIITIANNLVANSGSHIYVNKYYADSISSRTNRWAFFKVKGKATLNGTIHVSYNDAKWTPKEGEYVRVLDCDGGISGTPEDFDLPSLPEGLGWDTSTLLTQGIITVVSSTGISDVNAETGDFVADVYTLSGFKVATIKTSKETLVEDLQNRGLASGTYVVRSPKVTMKVVLR